MTTPTPTTPTTHRNTKVSIGKTVPLAARAKTSRCRLGAEPDRRCSPGAYYSGLTTAVLCSSSFHTGTVRNVQESEKHAVEAEYGMTPRNYGSTLEIDHIISLELGGSNDISNLFPEQAVIAGGAGYHVKDRLENRLHAMVCAGEITLSAAQHQIATNWEALYARVFGGPALRRLAAGGAVPGPWHNCKAVNRRYPHGIGRPGAHDETSGTPVTTFMHSIRLYKLAMKYNRGLDRDHDGIACETG